SSPTLLLRRKLRRVFHFPYIGKNTNCFQPNRSWSSIQEEKCPPPGHPKEVRQLSFPFRSNTILWRGPTGVHPFPLACIFRLREGAMAIIQRELHVACRLCTK